VQNRAPITAANLTFSLSARQGGQIYPLLDTGAFSLSAGETRSFTVTSTAEAEGLITLNGKVIQNDSVAVEITDQFEVAQPAIFVSVIAPEAVGSEAFDIHLQFKNEGKIEGKVNLGVQRGEFEDSQVVTAPAGETRVLHYTQQIREDANYTFTFTGDLEQIINKRVSYGLAASMALSPQAVYSEGSVALPLTITNAGPLAGTMEVIFKLFSPPSSPLPSKEDSKVYYLAAGGSIADIIYFNLAEGDYQLVAASQAPVVTGQASFSVRKENRVDLGILAETQEGGMISVGVNLSNSGCNDLSGRVSVRVSDGSQVVWENVQSLAQLAQQNSYLLTFPIDPSALRPGDYILTTEFVDNGGQTVGLHSSPLSVRGPAFQITQLPSIQTFDPGQEANFTFRVKNTGHQPGTLEFHFKSYDRIDIARQE
jgi:hypothetical protein